MRPDRALGTAREHGVDSAPRPNGGQSGRRASALPKPESTTPPLGAWRAISGAASPAARPLGGTRAADRLCFGVPISERRGTTLKPTRMLIWTIGAGLTALVALGASGQGQVASEEEALQVAEERSRTMKSMGRSMRTLKGFAGGRGSEEEASAAAAVIAEAAPTIASLFPAGSGMGRPFRFGGEGGHLGAVGTSSPLRRNSSATRRRCFKPPSRQAMRARSEPHSATSARTAAAAATASSARSATVDHPLRPEGARNMATGPPMWRPGRARASSDRIVLCRPARSRRRYVKLDP